jgi:glycosyltransferase involved in cell wall biosynthesis
VRAQVNPTPRRGTAPLRVLWVLGSNTLDPAELRTNGVEVLFSRAVRRFDPERTRIAVAYPDFGPMRAGFDDAGVQRFHLPVWRGWDVGLIRRLGGFVDRCGARLVHSQSGPIDLYSAIAARRRGAVHLITRHGAYRDTPVAPWRRRAYMFIDRLCVALGTHFVAIAEHGRRALEGQGIPGDRISVIYNGHEVPPLASVLPRAVARRRFGLGASGPVVGMAARFEAGKRADLLLRAVARLRIRHPRLVVLLAGNGPEVPALQTLSARLGIGAATRFLGFVPDLAPFYDALDCLVLPSQAEALPNVLCEALARGCPCVATRVGGIPEIFHDGECGLLVPPDDAEALEAALREVLAHPERRAAWGRAGRRRIKGSFSLVRMVDGYQALYERLTSA